MSFLFDSKGTIGLLFGFSVIQGFMDPGVAISVSFILRYATVDQYLFEEVTNNCTIGYMIVVSALFTPSTYRRRNDPVFSGFQISFGTTGLYLEAPLDPRECFYFELKKSDIKRMGINSCSVISISKLLRKVKARIK